MIYSINLVGIVFFVEADGYIALKAYLQSLYQYFERIEDGQEILVDLQTRMAEILLEYNQKQQKTHIFFDDIALLIQTIGKVEDFEEAENNPAFQSTYQEEKQTQPNKEEDKIDKIFAYLKQKDQENKQEKNNTLKKNLKKEEKNLPKKLYRDIKRKKIGGVLAGFSYFFNLNSLWLRLFYFLFSFFNLSFGILVYIICWIFIPIHKNLPDQEEIKKIYRDSTEGTLAGVCKGLGEYFKISPLYMRIAFISLSFFGGIGIGLYILLWILMPDAKSFVDELEMEGQKIDAENLRLLIDKYYSIEKK
ncbi:MAG: PspC domain-containing protein [Bacteroidetes bacterium]|nr:MAG: PspC domain-containing protein [Bacteroidota bacterium]TAG88916.1 MAG: PspC domain-containing protein [Bacteroidota bacterium]